MSKIEWRPPMGGELQEYDHVSTDKLVAVGEGQREVVLCLLGHGEDHAGVNLLDVYLEVLRADGTSVSTVTGSEWPAVAEVVPVREWPAEVYAGKNVAHDAVPELRGLLDVAIAEVMA